MDKKEKARWARIKRVYGITQDDYNRLDKGYCPICLREWGNTVRPVVDHDHGGGGQQGFVRGICCAFCNHYRIGRFRDPSMVYRIADYLRDAPRDLLVPPKKPKKRSRKRQLVERKKSGKNPPIGV